MNWGGQELKLSSEQQRAVLPFTNTTKQPQGIQFSQTSFHGCVHGGYGTTWAVILKCHFPLAWNSSRWLGWPASPRTQLPQSLQRWDYNKHEPSPPICLSSPTPLFFSMDSKKQTYIFMLVNPLGVVMSLGSNLFFCYLFCFVYSFHKNL